MVADAARHRLVVTVEDGFAHGGAGEFLEAAVRAASRTEGLAAPAVRVLGVPRVYVAQGDADALLAELGLDGAGVAASVRGALDGSPEPAHTIPLAPHQAGEPPLVTPR
jgi:1-deoxy-D-xylulose-5-phosphate synthase